MKERKLKRFVIPTLVAIMGLILIIILISVDGDNNELKEEPLNFVSSTIISEEKPVINTINKVILPYTDNTVTIGKSYYDYKATSEQQEKSITYHENTYIQNSGIDFINENQFDVVAVLSGTVSNIREDELLGKIIEINHNNEYVSIYQSLEDIKVKKGDQVNQGQLIALSGTNKMDKELGNHLHFEFYANGQIVNPSLYLDKELKG